MVTKERVSTGSRGSVIEVANVRHTLVVVSLSTTGQTKLCRTSENQVGRTNSKMKRLSTDANVRHTSVCCGGGLHPTKRQTKVCGTTIALLVFLAASVVPPYGQEIKTQTAPHTSSEQTIEDLKPGSTTPSAETHDRSAVESKQTDANQDANNTGNEPFVFPTKRERFNRYVKSTVGPFSLVYTGVTAGLNQWRDNPEEWEQGASGYGKRYASSSVETRFSKPSSTDWILRWDGIRASRKARAKDFSCG